MKLQGHIKLRDLTSHRDGGYGTSLYGVTWTNSKSKSLTSKGDVDLTHLRLAHTTCLWERLLCFMSIECGDIHMRMGVLVREQVHWGSRQEHLNGVRLLCLNDEVGSLVMVVSKWSLDLRLHWCSVLDKSNVWCTPRDSWVPWISLRLYVGIVRIMYENIWDANIESIARLVERVNHPWILL